MLNLNTVKRIVSLMMASVLMATATVQSTATLPLAEGRDLRNEEQVEADVVEIRKLLKDFDNLDVQTIEKWREKIKNDEQLKTKFKEIVDENTWILLQKRVNAKDELHKNDKDANVEKVDANDILESIEALEPQMLRSFYEALKSDENVRPKIVAGIDEPTAKLIYDKIVEAVALDEKYDGLATLKKELLDGSDLKVEPKFMTRNDCIRVGRVMSPVKGIMIHSTACPGVMPKTWYKEWNKSYQKGEIAREACVHVFLNDEGALQILPWNHRGWHCGGAGNNYLISIEICESNGIIYSQAKDKILEINIDATREYFEKAYNNAVNLCVLLCKQFNLTAKDIISHCEGHTMGIASDHGDPEHWFKFYGKDMYMFREDVKKQLDNSDSYAIPVPGLPTLKNLLITSLFPAGRTLYIWGGGWNEEDNGAGDGAICIGIRPEWKDFYDTQGADYDFKNHRYELLNGLDCSGFIGWLIYNVFNTEPNNLGYVMPSSKMAAEFSNRGFGTFRAKEDVVDHKVGDIMSGSGHVYMCICEFVDGSVLLVHSSPPGVQVNGTTTKDGNEDSTAIKVATYIMQRFYPEWSKKFNTFSKGVSYLTDYSQMRWTTDGTGKLTDPDGYFDKEPYELLVDLFRINGEADRKELHRIIYGE